MDFDYDEQTKSLWSLWIRPCYLQRKARLSSVEIDANSRIRNVYKIREWKDSCGKLYWCKREGSFCVTPVLWGTFVGSFWKSAFSELRDRYCTRRNIYHSHSYQKRREFKKYLGKFFRSIFPSSLLLPHHSTLCSYNSFVSWSSSHQ